MKPFAITVECYAGHRGEETPRVIVLDGRRIRVDGVLDRWLGSDHRYFKLWGDDGATYIVRRRCQRSLGTDTLRAQTRCRAWSLPELSFPAPRQMVTGPRPPTGSRDSDRLAGCQPTVPAPSSVTGATVTDADGQWGEFAANGSETSRMAAAQGPDVFCPGNLPCVRHGIQSTFSGPGFR